MQRLSIVNENDEVVGEETRENIHKKGLLHREVHVWVYNNKEELLFQERSMIKDTYPGLFDVSVGSHVEIGEEYERTALRELEEETGIKARKNDLTFIASIRGNIIDELTGMKNNSIKKIYAFRFDGNVEDLKVEDGEAVSLRFFPIERILNLSEEESKKFTPEMMSEEFRDVFRKIKLLALKK
ncbi:MAG: NUDIX domain-containing protein [Parcubacteria group bacterium]|jgi:isopentenyl-diphosphate delta-isomerase type 1